MNGLFFTLLLLVGTLLTALVAGLLFTFAVIVMPGIRTLGDREFVRSFQEMDGIIQRNHPLFVLVWGGSALFVLLAAVFGTGQIMLVAAAAAYFLGVQLPTVVVNVPLNNAVQRIDTQTAGDEALGEARRVFESRWNRWNQLRTVVAIAVTAALLLVMVNL